MASRMTWVSSWTRANFVVALAATFLNLAPPAAHAQAANAPAVATPTSSAAELKAWRQPAKDRQRRIIFNNDGNEPWQGLKALTPEAVLEMRTTPLLGSQVDSIFYCSSATFGTFHHFTKIGQVFTTREPPYENNRSDEMLKAGLDPLRVMTDFGKQHHIEIFWSMRMNDVHDHGDKDYGPVRFNFNRLKTQHPEYLLGKKGERSRYGAWSAVNYGREEIRDYAFRFFEEVCENYDVDGVEMDFFRHPVFFKATRQNKPVGDAERAQMTELMRRIRRMADAVGRKRGRPILIAMRLPDSVDYCRAIGLDIERWLSEDLLDLMTVSGYFQLNDWEYSVALGHQYSVKVYPSLDESRVRDTTAKAMRVSLDAYRGRAANAWAAGADGIYVFNVFDPSKRIWHEIGDAAGLARLNRDFFGSIRGTVGANGGNLAYDKYQRLETLTPNNPKALPPGKTVAARIGAGAGYPADATAKWLLRIKLSAATPPPGLQVKINGRPLQVAPAEDGWLESTLRPADVHPRMNEVSLTVDANAPAKLQWLDLMIRVRP